MSTKHISIFASGSGSNAIKIMEHLNENVAEGFQFTIFCNNPEAGILEKGRRAGAEVILFNRKDFKGGVVLEWLNERNSELVVLAGFLWLMPTDIVQAFQGKMINIHPSLLPKYGGKGMYGMNVHTAVIEAGDSHSGITIHHVDEQYDQGQIIVQETCEITSEDTPQTLQRKVQVLEHKYFPKVVEDMLEKKD